MLSSQLSVAVWPYIAFTSTVSETALEHDVQNVGAGPALIRSAILLIDGSPQPSIAAGLRELGNRHTHGVSVTVSSLQ